jgi:hypothetical protein
VTIKKNEPAPARDTASVLLGIEGVTVTGAVEGPDGRLAVWAWGPCERQVRRIMFLRERCPCPQLPQSPHMELLIAKRFFLT